MGVLHISKVVAVQNTSSSANNFSVLFSNLSKLAICRPRKCATRKTKRIQPWIQHTHTHILTQNISRSTKQTNRSFPGNWDTLLILCQGLRYTLHASFLFLLRLLQITTKQKAKEDISLGFFLDVKNACHGTPLFPMKRRREKLASQHGSIIPIHESCCWHALDTKKKRKTRLLPTVQAAPWRSYAVHLIERTAAAAAVWRARQK